MFITERCSSSILISLFCIITAAVFLHFLVLYFRAAAIMVQTGPVVTLQVAKFGASYHGVRALLNGPPTTGQNLIKHYVHFPSVHFRLVVSSPQRVSSEAADTKSRWCKETGNFTAPTPTWRVREFVLPPLNTCSMWALMWNTFTAPEWVKKCFNVICSFSRSWCAGGREIRWPWCERKHHVCFQSQSLHWCKSLMFI